MTDLNKRVAALELSVKPRIDIAERMRLARERRRGMTPEQLQAESAARRAWILRWYESSTGTPAPSQWHAGRHLCEVVAKELFGK